MAKLSKSKKKAHGLPRTYAGGVVVSRCARLRGNFLDAAFSFHLREVLFFRDLVYCSQYVRFAFSLRGSISGAGELSSSTGYHTLRDDSMYSLSNGGPRGSLRVRGRPIVGVQRHIIGFCVCDHLFREGHICRELVRRESSLGGPTYIESLETLSSRGLSYS